MNDRDMYYNSYGYGGFIPQEFPPQTNMPTQISPMIHNQIPSNMTNTIPNTTYANTQFNDMNERINRLERQVKRLDQRLTRLETPYANTNNFQGNEPDTNMYMM